MKKKTKFLSVFLSFCMIVSCMAGMSITAGADNTRPTVTILPADAGTVEVVTDPDNENNWKITASPSGNYRFMRYTYDFDLGSGSMYFQEQINPWSFPKSDISEGYVSNITAVFDAPVPGEGTPETPWLIGKNNNADVEAYLSGTADNLTLNISGSGEMKDFEYYSDISYPWKESSEKIKTAVVGSDVTNIGKETFFCCKNLSSVTLAESVTSIGENAFKATALTSITLPGKLEIIGSAAFNGLGLTSITIPGGVNYIGSSAFYGCTSLTKVTFERPNTAHDLIIDRSAFEYYGGSSGLGTNPINAPIEYSPENGFMTLFDGNTEITASNIAGDIDGKALSWKSTVSEYTITIPSTLNVKNPGWNSIGSISATGTLASGKKLKIKAVSDNDFALVNEKDKTQKIPYTLRSASADTDAVTSWEFTELDAAAAAEQPIGIDVEDYSDKPAGTYTDGVTFTVSVESTLKSLTINMRDTDETATIWYNEGETWGQAIANHADKNSYWITSQSAINVYRVAYYCTSVDNTFNLYAGNDQVYTDDVINASASYLIEYYEGGI